MFMALLNVLYSPVGFPITSVLWIFSAISTFAFSRGLRDQRVPWVWTEPNVESVCVSVCVRECVC